MQTVIGVFDNATDARRAADAIAQEGLDRTRIHLQAAGEQDIARTWPDAEAGSHWLGATRGVTDRSGLSDASNDTGGGVMHRIGHFFASLFGSSEDESDRFRAGYYAEAVRRGSCVLSVDAADEREALIASDGMRRCGAIDIDRRAEHWRNQGWSGFDASAPTYTQEQAMAERASYGAELVPPPSAGSISPELHHGDAATAPLGGVRVFRRVTEQPVSERRQTIDDTVRRTDVDIERLQSGGAGAAGAAYTGVDWSSPGRNRRIEGSYWSGVPPIPQRRRTDRPSVWG